jgi:LAGLIDADG DNA endonuclease family protein
LAGLIEGDGSIIVHDKNTKAKKYRPKIIIVFNLADKPLAEKLSFELKVGKVISKPNAGHVLLQILAKDEVLKIINLINGYMRTPKIEALHRAIY